MRNLIQKIALGAIILGSLTSCIAATDGYSNSNQSPYYNASYNNGYYYAPNSYYGNGGYYANDGYYYRDNMNYQYENNVPYYYGQNKRKIYVQRQTNSQRPPNGLYDPNTSQARNRPQVNSYGSQTRNYPTRNTNNEGVRNQNNSNYRRTEPTINTPQQNPVQNRDENGGGFRNTNAPQTNQTPTRIDTGRDGSR